jgi:uncharacterized protein
MTTPKVLTVKCPTCSTPVTWNEKFPERPFCSERCKLIDLGAWASESYTIPVQESAVDWPEDSAEPRTLQ